MKDFKPFFAKVRDKERVADLRDVYTECRRKHPKLPDVTTKGDMELALRAYEEANPELCTPEPSTEQLYGFTRGRGRLDKYVQWVYVPAVKDAGSENSEERGNAFTQLLARSVRTKLDFAADLEKIREKATGEYRALLESRRDALTNLANSLETRLRLWATDDAVLKLDWKIDEAGAVNIGDPKATVRTGDSHFLGHLSRMGHGLQRSYLCALLQELAVSESTSGPRLLLAIEEPELYQHPPQARHMAELLHDLVQDGAQVLYCTHSPLFVSGRHFHHIRRVDLVGNPRAAKVYSAPLAKIKKCLDEAIPSASGRSAEIGVDLSEQQHGGLVAQLEAALQPHLSELFFARSVVLVEGIEDEAYIRAALQLEGRWSEFRRYGCHIVHANGKGYMIRPYAVAKLLNIPTYLVFDADSNQVADSKRSRHEVDNKALLQLSGSKGLSTFPTSPAMYSTLCIWPTNLTKLVREEVGERVYSRVSGSVCQSMNYVKGIQKNPVFVARTMAQFWVENKKPLSLVRLIDRLIAFAASADGAGKEG